MAKKTTKPTGLSLSRDGYKFTLTWTPRGDTCTAQEARTIVTTRNPSPKTKKLSDVKKGTKSKSDSLTTLGTERGSNAKYKPLGPNKLTKVRFEVRGKGGKKKKWSGWEYKEYKISAPSRPAYVAPEASSQNFTYVYKWDYNEYENNSTVIFVDYEWQTLLYESDVSSGSDLSSDIWNRFKDQKISYIDPRTEETKTNQPSTGHGTYTSISIIDDTTAVSAGLRRFFRVRARGPAGNSDWRYSDHSFAAPNAPVVTKGKIDISKTGAGTSVTLDVKTTSSHLRPTDDNVFKYAIVYPRTAQTIDSDDWARASLSLPNGFDEWTEGTRFGSTGTTSKFSFHTNSVIEANQGMYVMVTASNSGGTASSTPVLVKSSENEPLVLAKPTLGTITPHPETGSITIEVTNNTDDLENNKSFIAVYFRSSDNQEEEQIIGIIPYNQNQPQTATFFIPEYESGVSPSIGVACHVADYYPASKVIGYPGELTYYKINNPKMSSGITWQDNVVPLPPVPVLSRAKEGTIQVSFDWPWISANLAEISWADDPDAWQSTSEPSTFSIDRASYTGKWNITGLSAGKWYVRVRLIKTEGDSSIYGTYSDVIPYDLSSAPSTPTLYLTPKVLAVDSILTATWLYSSTDGTGQANAQLAEAFKVYQKTQDQFIVQGKVYYILDNGVYIKVDNPVAADLENYYEDTGNWTYTNLDNAMTSGGSSIQFAPSTYGWTEGSTHYVSLRVQSASGHQSEGWSNPVKVDIASLPVITVTGIGDELDAMHYVTIPIGEPEDEDERVDLSLVRLPLEFSVTGAGAGGYTTAVITRADGFSLDRPDDSKLIGFKGETILEKTVQNESNLIAPFTLDLEDFKNSASHLDDEAPYNLTISVTDTYGQTVKAGLDKILDRESDLFYVHWEHQAVMPSATVTYDENDGIAKIFVPQPESGYLAGDYFEIYRMSADRPQKIVENGVFNTWYVDPFPTYGIFSGYRIVYVTKFGDYRLDGTGDLTWEDYGPMEEDLENRIGYLSEFAIRLDFDNKSLVLPGNVSLSNAWNKDFQLTRYLGGSMEGDWNPGVERTGSFKAVVPIENDPELMYNLRLLADYAGAVHVRTPDGSNFYANININDDREAKWVTRLSQVTLTVTKVDSVVLDGMTLAEWQAEDNTP